MEFSKMLHPPRKTNVMKRYMYLMMLFITLTGFSSTERTITGTVYSNDDKLPLPGVMVVVEGTKLQSITDKQGRYLIKVPEGKHALLFLALGFEQQKLLIGKKETADIFLRPSNASLQEIVVVGYRPQQKQSRVMAQSSSSYSPTNNTALAGKVAGLAITRTRSNYAQGTESYKGYTENKFYDPKSVPLSTFAVDVDAASYSNIRRHINNGTLPQRDAVRIEEMINYFQYDLSGPAGDAPVAIHTELSSAPWNTKHRLLRIGLKAKSIPTAQLPASNFVFLIDVSGSMSDYNKLPLVQSSLKLLVDQLRPIDHVSIVTYAGNAGLKLASTPGNQKMKIKDAIETLDAGGSTAGGAGIKLAYQIAREGFIKGGNNRIILATDGDFNVGASSDDDMERLIEIERKSGVSLSVLGYGMGNIKDSKMETLADKGHGNYAYIDNISEARKSIVTEFGATLFTVAKDVKLQIEFNPARVAAYRLIGYENRLLEKEDFNNDQKLGGDMGVGHTVTALYEIVPAGAADDFPGAVDQLKYQKTSAAPFQNSSNEMVTVKFRYKNPNASKSKLVQVAVEDKALPLQRMSNDFRFSTAVAEFGMLLRNSKYKQQADYDQLIARAKAARGKDEEGYRTEFISLAESAKLLSKSLVAAEK
jgi:Ca-activated chloride channel family protein